MSDGFCVGRGILHLTGYAGLMMDETGDYACGNHHARCAPFETLVYTCVCIHACVRAYACTYIGPEGPVRRIRARRIPSYPAGSPFEERDGDGDEFLQGYSALLSII